MAGELWVSTLPQIPMPSTAVPHSKSSVRSTTKPKQTTQGPKKRKVSEATREARRKAAEARREEAVAVLDAGVDHVAEDPEALRAYLEFSARFHRYSQRNALLLFQQMLERGASASHFMGYRAWQGEGRQVKKGEKGYAVFAPVTRKLCGEDEGASRSPAAGVEDGTSRLVAFRVATVFDIDQTDVIPGQEETALRYVSPIGRLESADHLPLLRTLEAVTERIGFSLVRYEDHEMRAGGYCKHQSREIGLARTAPDQQAKTLAHELAHAVAHTPSAAAPAADGDRLERPADRGHLELQAEGAAYLVCFSLGLDTASFSMPYLRRWCRGGTAEERREEIKAQLAAIDQIARRLLALVDEAEQASVAAA